MKTIELSKGFVALVDDELFDDLSIFKWSVSNKKSHGKDLWYAVRQVGGRGSKHTAMHRLIAGTPLGLVCDHLNGNTLDNRRCNLENITHIENMKRARNWGKKKKEFGVIEIAGSLAGLDF